MPRVSLDSESRYHSLQICDLSLQVHLGCEPEERKFPQEVRVSVEFRFNAPPKGIESDHLADTICYARISEAFKQYCEGREFALIEKLAQGLMTVARQIIEGRAQAVLSVHKVRPPVQGLIGGTIYRLGDFQ